MKQKNPSKERTYVRIHKIRWNNKLSFFLVDTEDTERKRVHRAATTFITILALSLSSRALASRADRTFAAPTARLDWGTRTHSSTQMHRAGHVASLNTCVRYHVCACVLYLYKIQM